MSNGYSIMRHKKLKKIQSIHGSSRHSYRAMRTPNANQERLALNKTIIGTAGDVVKDVQNRLNQLNTTIKKDNVLCIEYLLTASHKFFGKISKEEKQKWVDKNIQWLKDIHGEENVVHALLHEDETTPHIVAYVVPEFNGKLNAKNFLGGKKKCSDLVTSHANYNEEFGLERGVKGSTARHQRVRRYYSHVNFNMKILEKRLQKVEMIKPLPDPTISELVQAKVAFINREKVKAQYIKESQESINKLIQSARSALLRVEELEKEKDSWKEAFQAEQRINIETTREFKEKNETIQEKNGIIEHLEANLSKAYTEIAEMEMLTKEQVSELRKLNVSAVAQELQYTGEIKKKENAIDLVKRVCDFDYEQAISWLNLHFPNAEVINSAVEYVNVQEPTRLFKPIEKAIKKKVEEQIEALGCDSFRLTVVPKDEDDLPYVPGNRNGIEKFYSKKDLINNIPWLLAINKKEEKHIYITPMDKDAYYVLIDDLRITPEELEQMGYEPCLIQKTSWNSTQAILKLPITLDRKSVLHFFNEINKNIGDPKMTALRHPIRMAGFWNIKEKHERKGDFPIVSIEKASNRFCTRSTREVMQFMEGQEPPLPEHKM